MWPSLESAAKIYDWSNIGLIGALVLGVICTVLVVWMGNVKGEYLARELAAVNRKAAEANQKAEEERLARVELEAKLAWRRIPKAKQSEIAARLIRFSGQVVALWYGAGDKEAETFALEIASTLAEAKWRVAAPASMVMFAGSGRPFDSSTIPLETGVTIGSPLSGVARKAEDALLNELATIGFDVANLPDSRRDKSTASFVTVTVNVRPEGAQGEAKLRAPKAQ